MQFRILSHACLQVSTETTSIIVDPWLLGSCYWRSWWNFPRVEVDEASLARTDAVVISHIHWDHWHGHTLKKFFAGKPILVPDEPGLRSEADLRACGFDDVRRAPHARAVQVGDIKITMYQFGLLLNDSAIVIEADGVTLLNANDAKIAGAPLENILARHRPIDFALRSHSSANIRVCFEVENGEAYNPDDRDHYVRAFTAFMDRVKPRYAIPFASNHCHLHDDVLRFNTYITNPLELRQTVLASGRAHDWKLQVMLPGSGWSTGGGFDLRDETPFSDIEAELARYRRDMAGTLEKNREQENRVRINDAVLKRFAAMAGYAPPGLKAAGRLLVTLFWPDGREQTYDFDIGARAWDAIETPLRAPKGRPVIRIPAAVFRDAVIKNMFHHAGISKRCRFIAHDAEDMAAFARIFRTLERFEHGIYPLNAGYLARLARAYLRRWRELLVYATAAFRLKVRRQPMYLVEESILREGW